MNTYPACQIYKGRYVFQETNIGKTNRNYDIQWKEHEDIRKEPEPMKHSKIRITNSNVKPFPSSKKLAPTKKSQSFFYNYRANIEQPTRHKRIITFVIVSLDNFLTHCKYVFSFFY